MFDFILMSGTENLLT